MTRGAAPTLHCPRCGHDAPPGGGAIAFTTCTACGLVFDERAGAHPPVAPVQRRLRTPWPLPRGFRAVEERGALVLRWTPHRALGIALGIVVALAWLGLATIDSPVSTAFTAVFVALLAVATYLALALLLNRNVVRVGATEIVTRFGPIPLGRALRTPVAELDQVYVVRFDVNGEASYHVVAAYRGGGERTLGFTPTHELALELEQRIERRLGIRDREMPRELPD